MTPKEFTSRCSAIILITASAYGIALAAEPSMRAPTGSSAGGNVSIQSPAADNAITARVKGALTSNQIKINDLDIQTELGIVTLVGTVASEAQRQKVAHIVAAVDGVRSVDIASLNVKRT